MEIHGFPQGNFTIARGGSFTTDALTSDVSYYGTWPSSGCMKGSGTVSVTAAPSPPPSSPPSSGSSSGTTSGSSTNSTQSRSSTSTASPSTTSTSNDTAQPPQQSPVAPQTSGSKDNALSQKQSVKHQAANASKGARPAAMAPQSPGLKDVATLGGGGLAIILVGGFIAWRMLSRRQLHQSAGQSVAIQQKPVESNTNQPTTPEPTSQPNLTGIPEGQTPVDPQDDNR